MNRPLKVSASRKSNGRLASRYRFRSDRDVKAFWQRVWKVPARRRRTKRDEERYCLGLYLLALATHKQVIYPLRVEESESPDFVITSRSGEKIGLEITKATAPWIQREMAISEAEYQRREAVAKRLGKDPEPVGILLSERGWVGDQVEAEWLSFVQQAIERKVTKLDRFKPLSRQDLLLYDDTPLPAVDRQKVLAELKPWLRALKRRVPLLGRVSIIISLDVVLDLGDDFQILQFIDWSGPHSLPDFGERVEFAGAKAVRTEVRKHEREGQPVYLMDRHGRIVKRMPDGRRYEVRVEQNGEEVVVGEIPAK